jgi:hypothetical protein
MEAACERALVLKAYRYADVKSILERGLYIQQVIAFPQIKPDIHDNIRGSNYYSIS